ncbi:MAG: CBS domain-containing protein [Clostridium argentinense]|uniref:CBS domain-containing protein n=1 Tax=Clostridium butanoliproducens TaxID=2991837 RepID=UPI001D59FE65|nr:CBS domain-containing protein [Clostridium butanoliproducens]MBS5822898.1 CBS domain-containing protein [Clostridium argentinense]MDU1349089.1 CBS domain-containing protein [Clostridium argentinense]
MKINDVMTKEVIKIDGKESVDKAAKMMKQYNIGSIPVYDKDKIIGIITDRDIVVRVMADEKNIKETTVREVMTSNPVCLASDKDVTEAARVMSERQIRRIIVKDEEEVKGIVSLGDLAVEKISKEEIGETLKEISTPCGPCL